MTDDKDEKIYTTLFKSIIRVSPEKLVKKPADSPFRVVYEQDEEEEDEKDEREEE